jgi:hypothetical protein
VRRAVRPRRRPLAPVRARPAPRRGAVTGGGSPHRAQSPLLPFPGGRGAIPSSSLAAGAPRGARPRRQLPSRLASGHLPGGVEKLGPLRELAVRGNPASAGEVRGAPATAAVLQLANLRVLDLSGNKLTGGIPPEVRHCRDLVKMDLSKNFLGGQVPFSIAELKNLDFLSLSENNFSGEIPSCLGQLRSLKFLNLSSNSLSGEVPIDFAALQNQSVLLLDNNKKFSLGIPAVPSVSSVLDGNNSSVREATIDVNPLAEHAELFTVSGTMTSKRVLAEGSSSGGGLGTKQIVAIASASAITEMYSEAVKTFFQEKGSQGFCQCRYWTSPDI